MIFLTCFFCPCCFYFFFFFFLFYVVFFFIFFFSSRRRHTRSLCDWSSDVCSSDLSKGIAFLLTVMPASPSAFSASLPRITFENTSTSMRCVSVPPEITRKPSLVRVSARTRSEERRVGKECRSRRAT